MVRIIDLTSDATELIEQVAAMLVDQLSFGWTTLDAARDEVRESFGEGRVSRVALDDEGAALGWIGAIPVYDYAWELHPLVVRGDRQGRGVGTALVRDLEAQLRARGTLTLYLGSDDVAGQTSAAGIDLFPDLLGQAAHLRVTGRHPVDFYRRLGYVVVGLIPDANGPGRPDILMARRIGPVELPPPAP